jgi:hypothetical protein
MAGARIGHPADSWSVSNHCSTSKCACTNRTSSRPHSAGLGLAELSDPGPELQQRHRRARPKLTGLSIGRSRCALHSLRTFFTFFIFPATKDLLCQEPRPPTVRDPTYQ